VDTTSEGSHPDPLFVAVRDADNEGCTVECMLSVAEAEDTSSSGLADCILQRSDAGLDAGNLDFQSHYFASTMFGKYRGHTNSHVCCLSCIVDLLLSCYTSENYTYQ